jgi:glutamate N-acetyltransferase / amino-acid N-acetyltransferase
MKEELGSVLDVPGFTAGAVAAGIKYRNRNDLCLIYSQVPACAAGVFTTNRVKAAPVLLDAERIAGGRAQAIVANSGNANACTGAKGREDARAMARLTAEALGIDENLVLVASTGVIGFPLNISAVGAGLPALVRQLTPSGFPLVAKAIMTTDTFAKMQSRCVSMGEKNFTVTAVAKGAGMIRPDMATMLCLSVPTWGRNPDF